MLFTVDHIPIDREGLIRFILNCQDPRGGLSDRPMDERDLYHTYLELQDSVCSDIWRKRNFQRFLFILPMHFQFLWLRNWD